MRYSSPLFLLLALSMVPRLYAQQDPGFSLYRYNMELINPAYAGANGGLEATAGVQSQWAGIKGAPEVLGLNVNSPVGKNVGLGASIVNDRFHVVSETHLYADFSYRINLGTEVDLYAGLKAGGSVLKIDLAGLVPGDPLFSDNLRTVTPNVGLGLYLKGKKYYLSISAPGLLENERFDKKGKEGIQVRASDNVHFYAGAGYDFSLDDDFTLRPSVMARLVSGAPTSIDLTASALYRDRFELGGSYRINEGFTGFLTMKFLERLTIGYAYESPTTDLGKYSNGTHGVILRMAFGK